MRQLCLLLKADVSRHQAVHSRVAGQGLGCERQRFAGERDRRIRLARENLKGLRRERESLGRLRGDLIGVTQAEEGLAVESFVQMLRFTARRAHRSTRKFDHRQHGRLGEPGVHQQVDLQLERRTYHRVTGRQQARLHACLGCRDREQWQVEP
ncbi:hypothetical protein D3C81_1732060 [compost metagenome]